MRRVLWVLATALLAAPPADAGPTLGGWAVDLPGRENDDAFELVGNASSGQPEGSVSLEGWTLTDGEGVLAFPAGAQLGPDQRIRVGLNATAYREAARAEPDFALTGLPANRTLIVVDPGFALAQDGDELLLVRDGTMIDAVVWGDSDYSGPAWTGPPVPLAGDTFLRWVPRRTTTMPSTLGDWDHPQRWQLGWREPELPTFTFEAGALAYTAPDQSHAVASEIIAAATRSLRINIYEWRDTGLAQDLLTVMRGKRGLEVRVLVDTEPVGLTAEERLVRDRILSEFQTAGAHVRVLTHGRYNFDHAKYIVADERISLVQTENFVPGGVPVDGRSGNRGWGIVLDDPDLGRALAAAFDWDFAEDSYGAQPPLLGAGADVPLPGFASESPRPTYDALTTFVEEATLVVGPEAHLAADDALLEMLRSATDEILVHQLTLPPHWKDASGRQWPNQYLDALVAAAQRGVAVRVLLDGHFDPDAPDGNGVTVDRLTEAGAAAALVDGDDEPVQHVKGVVVDRQSVWLGSMNWNLNSVAQNREVSVRFTGLGAADFFADVFEEDWARWAGPSEEPLPDVGAAVTVICLALLVAALMRRRTVP